MNPEHLEDRRKYERFKPVGGDANKEVPTLNPKETIFELVRAGKADPEDIEQALKNDILNPGEYQYLITHLHDLEETLKRRSKKSA